MFYNKNTDVSVNFFIEKVPEIQHLKKKNRSLKNIESQNDKYMLEKKYRTLKKLKVKFSNLCEIL
ncbi:hypothetical protein BpHYR1_001334 [Brachionus plicatilis]|uniref:Uncharacterized protein n=1 Tax=Brachionus plicatilis TaxID=10195 RepID=A0A3M7TAD4_BRAPC|nr:hypothetical protein BpHYR1_001334 [Brachionus plicatilis]